MRILFRTDGGATIGLGHLQRCLSLADALRRRGAQCFFLIFGDDAAVERARHAGFGAEAVDAEPGSDLDLAACADAARRLHCTAIVVDSYLVLDTYLAALRAAHLYVVAIDDLNEYPFPNQMVVSIGPHAPLAGYESSSGDTRFLLGPRFAILRPEYWDSPLPMLRERAHNVLVTAGGADPGDTTPSWLRALDGIAGDVSFTVIVGPFATNAAEVHSVASSSTHAVRVIQSPAAVRPVFAAADVAVSAAGQTLYELCALGIPTVAIEVARNQRPQLDAFAAAGALVSASASSIAGEAARLVGDVAARRAMSETARSLVDRRGALTVADEILAALGA